MLVNKTTKQGYLKNLWYVTWINKAVSSQTISILDFSKNDKKQSWKSKSEAKEIALSALKFATNLVFCLSVRKDIDLGKLVNIHIVPSL